MELKTYTVKLYKLTLDKFINYVVPSWAASKYDKPIK